MRLLEDLACYWRSIVVIVTPLVFLPLPIIHTSTESRCAYVLLVMAVYWLTESLPLPVTALVPMVLFPALAVLPAKQVAINYIKDTTMVFFGGLIMAAAIEDSNLHKRIALKVIICMGTKPRWLLLGFMLPTWFLSMWLSNTATTAMMIVVAEATLQQLKQGARKSQEVNLEGISNAAYTSNGDLTSHGINGQTTQKVNVCDTQGTQEGVEVVDLEAVECEVSSATPEDDALEKGLTLFSKALCLAVAYSANVGGVATLTGSPPNLVLKNVIDEYYSENGLGEESPITYASWMGFAIPISVICLVIAWFWLQLLFLGPRATCMFCIKGSSTSMAGDESVLKHVKQEYKDLGSFRFAEIANVVFFVILVLLWLTRAPGFVDGWGSLFSPGYVTDSLPAMLIAIALFAFPSQKPLLMCFRDENEKPSRRPALLDWQTMTSKCPWSAIFILGGGFALAEACTESGLSYLIGQQLSVLKGFPDWAIVLLVAALVAALTEVTSNTATTNLMLPILAELARSIGLHPLFLMLPATVAASFAFMLPVATPPNAIVFAYRHLAVLDMAKTGLAMNVVGVLVVTLAVNTWAIPMFSLNDSPFSAPVNVTTIGPL